MTGSHSFEYDAIPPGYYDQVLDTGHPAQRAWHAQKFARVRALLALAADQSLLDIGCGPGTFLGGYPGDRSGLLVGLDVAKRQVDYANEKYGTAFRRFECVVPGQRWPFEDRSFDAASLIEVIEHMERDQIRAMAEECARVLKPGATLVLTTPNYASHWPILEWLVGRLSKVAYEEQHITRFHRPVLKRQLASVLGDRFTLEYATTIHFIAPFLAVLSRKASDGVASALTPRHWSWPFGALIIARLKVRG